jgi:FKBP-type peptidyl-prolyl cis-trans isomerase FklB
MRDFKDLQIAVAGTGYVGLSIATLLAQHHKVTAVDVIPEKVDKLNRRQSPIQDAYIEKYLAENAKKDGVITTKSGLQYKVLTEGTGKSPKATDRVRCHYEGFLIDGTVFDSSVQRGEPAVFGLQQVIAGWTEGLQLMKEGGKTRFFIPYMLGYGEGGAGASIPPYAALIFDVELLEVI